MRGKGPTEQDVAREARPYARTVLVYDTDHSTSVKVQDD
jgi:hypothetical protein